MTFYPISNHSFHRWMGPFSPARGTRSGFRFHNHRIGCWVNAGHECSFWPLVSEPGATSISRLVLRHWHGGRVLFLPNGMVIKPLQRDAEVGYRVILGRFDGPLILHTPDGKLFDMSQPGPLRPGDPWAGPTTTGLECILTEDGSLDCEWYHPSEFRREIVRVKLRAHDRDLAAAFRRARLGASGGRVRITANGHIITNRLQGNRAWTCVYVGYVPPTDWGYWDHWIQKEAYTGTLTLTRQSLG